MGNRTTVFHASTKTCYRPTYDRLGPVARIRKKGASIICLAGWMKFALGLLVWIRNLVRCVHASTETCQVQQIMLSANDCKPCNQPMFTNYDIRVGFMSYLPFSAVRHPPPLQLQVPSDRPASLHYHHRHHPERPWRFSVWTGCLDARFSRWALAILPRFWEEEKKNFHYFTKSLIKVRQSKEEWTFIYSMEVQTTLKNSWANKESPY